MTTTENEISASKNGVVQDEINEDDCEDNNSMDVDPLPLDIPS